MRWFALLGCLGCIGAPTAPRPTATPLAAAPPTACALPAHPAPSTTGAAWELSFAPGSGGFTLVAGDGLVVAGGTGVGLISIDAASGAPCARLLDGASPAIDPYTQRARIAHGMLVGGARFAVGAIDLRSGRTRWTHDVAAGASTDEYALRDHLQVVATASAVIVQFRLRSRDGDGFRDDELVAALDPATGAERWRVKAAEHRRGERWADGSILLASDADRVYVRTPGTLVALDGATGARAWTATWPAAPPAIGPPTPGALVASDGSHVALSIPGRIRLFDARTGASRGEVAVPGEATELVVRRRAVYAAVEAAPGNAAVVAIDAAAARTRWSYPASYAVRRLRIDDELAYVLDGNGRVSGLELATARPRFGLNTSAFDLEVTRSPTGAPRVVVPGVSIAAFDPQGPAPPLAPFARWEIAESADGCRPHALAWVDGGDRVVWQRPLPARVQALSFGRCNELEVALYRRSPRSAAGDLFMVLGMLETASTVVEADVSGVLALRKADGAVVLDADAPSAPDALFFDIGEFVVTGLADCKGVARRGTVFARCGERFVYFNGTTAMLVAADTLRVEARGTYARNPDGPAVHQRASISLGRYQLMLDGVTHMQ